MAAKVSDTTARTARTTVQGGAGWVIVEALNAFGWDMTQRQYGIAVVIAGVVFSFAQNLIENHFGKALLKEVPQPDQPVVDNGEE